VAKARRAPQQLEDAIRRYVDLNNRDPKPFIGTKTADQILESLSRFCQRTSNSGHSREASRFSESMIQPEWCPAGSFENLKPSRG
jgi:hypothetical protein